MIVVDACAWVHALVIGGTSGDGARAALADDPVWTAPAHMPIEVLRTLQRGLRSGELTPEQSSRCTGVVMETEIDYVVPHPALIAHVWSMRDAVNLYDALYVSLALELRIPLVTADQRLARVARSLGATVLVTC